MVLSPLLLRGFRRAAWVAEPFTDLVTFGACRLLGFAHHDGLVRRLPADRVTAVAVAVMAHCGPSDSFLCCCGSDRAETAG
jgi:hypothetical protein